MTTTQTVRGIDASYYMTRDLVRATAFYNELLGLEPSMHVPGLVTEYTFAGGETFGIYQIGADDFYTSGTVMFAVDDVAAATEDAIARGIPFGQNGVVSDTPSCHMSFGSDPEGNQFIFHKRK